MATFGTLKTRVSTRLKDPSYTAVSESEVAAAINAAVKYYSDERFWFNTFVETVTLTVGSPTLALATNTTAQRILKGGVAINYSNQRYVLSQVSSEEYDRGNIQALGMPSAWVYRDSGFEVYPYPNLAYNVIVRGLKVYADLSATGDTNDFTTNAEDLVIYEALSRLYGEVRQDDKMEAYYTARAKEEKDKLKRYTNRMNATGRLQVEEM